MKRDSKVNTIKMWNNYIGFSQHIRRFRNNTSPRMLNNTIASVIASHQTSLEDLFTTCGLTLNVYLNQQCYIKFLKCLHRRGRNQCFTDFYKIILNNELVKSNSPHVKSHA